MKNLTTSAPGKLLLYGDHAVVYGYPCLVTAVDQRVYVTIRENNHQAFELQAPDLGLQSYTKPLADLGKHRLPKTVAFMETVYRNFLAKYPQKVGVSVVTKSDFSALFGFGSSSAVTVAFAKALAEFYEVEMTKKELFDLCFKTVLDVQGVGSGFDVASAVWGGTIYYKKGATEIEELQLPELPLTVAYTGIKADTPTLIRMVQAEYEARPDEIEEVFAKLGWAADQAKAALQTQDFKTAGDLMVASQACLKQLNVSSTLLDELTGAAVKAGAYGAKLSGAGGGDCMLALVSHDSTAAVEAALTDAGGAIMNVSLQAPGVRVEESSVKSYAQNYRPSFV